MAAIEPALRARIENDPWARALGVEFLELGLGYCRLAMTLRPHMVNFQGSPHGGVVFSLADIAFGAACNSHGPPAVALSVSISYLAPPPPGARLLAEGRMRQQGRRTGFYDITVTTDGGTLIAVVHCIAQRVGRPGEPARA